MMTKSRPVLSAAYRGAGMFCLLLICFFGPGGVQGQVSITTPYPAPAQSLTINTDTSLLTVEILFSGACSTNVATVKLAPGVSYVAGSVRKLSGTPGITIADQGGTSSKPTFSIAGVTSGGGLTFTIRRIAGCGSGASGKDTVTVTGSCGSATEGTPGINSYDILSPSLAIASPAAIINAVTGVTYSRNFSITNGGNGCLDTLRFYLVYPNGGLQLQSLYTGAVQLSPYQITGDTSFFKLSGVSLSADSMLCNGETASFTENIRVRGCNSTTTAYKASWGRSASLACNYASATSALSIANGVPAISAAFTRIQQLNWCQNGIFNLTYTNTASSGGVAAAAFNFATTVGYNAVGNVTAPTGITSLLVGRIDSIKIGSVTVPFVPATASVPARGNFSGLTSDPDGPGVGLDDLDGDGQFDDLPIGKSVTVTVYEHWIDNSASCPIPVYRFFTSHTASYTTMCGTAYTTNPLPASAGYSIQTTTGSIVVPAEISGGAPFNMQVCMNLSSMFEPTYKPKDSLYLDITLPPGVSLSGSGNIQYNGVAVPAANYYTETVGANTILHIFRKGKVNAFCFNADFVYDCVIGGTSISPAFNLYYKGDVCSAATEKYLCATRTITVRCPSPCPDGMVNYQPIATRTNLGWTDNTLNTRVLPGAVTGVAKYAALPLDTIQLIVPGRQYTSGLPYNNLYYFLQFAKVTGADVFSFVSGTFNQKTATNTYTTAIGAPTTTGSTSALQKLNWDLSSNLNSGAISNGDSAWLDLRFAVTRANNDLLFGASLQQVASTSSTLYNINNLGVKVACDSAHSINLLVSGNNVSNYTPNITISNCNAVGASTNMYEGNSTGKDIFPNEYRPQSIIDSVVITLPAGYVLYPTTNTTNSAYWSTPSTFTYMGSVNTGVVVDRGSNTWVIQNPYLSTGGWRLADLGNSSAVSYPLNYFISPTCAAVTGSQNYTARWYYRDFVYTGNPSAYVSKNYLMTTAILNNTVAKPALSLQNNSGTVSGILTQHYWDVQISSTGSGTAAYVWMALNKTGSSITIDSVVYGGAVMSATNYASGKTWYQLSAAGIPSGSNGIARVYFKYHNCTADSIQVSAGWNCPSYPTSPDTYPCTSPSQYLKVIPQQSQAQISISRQPGNGSSINLCTPDSLTIIVNSAQVANLLNPSVSVYPPTGITINNSVAVEYPLGSGIWQNITASAIGGGGYSINLNNLPAFSMNGVPGIYSDPSASGRQAKLKVTYSSDCSTISGSQFDFYVYGNNPCGTPATGNGSYVKSGTININGAAALTHFNSISLSGSPFGCSNTMSGGAMTLMGSITNNGPATSEVNEMISFSLPMPYRYVAGSIPAGTFANETIITNPDGSQLISWKYPANTPSGTSLTFRPKVYLDTTNGSSCGSSPSVAILRTVVSGTVSCGAVTCNSFTTQNGIANLSLQRSLPDVVSHISYSHAQSMDGAVWTWSVNGTLENNGATIPSGSPFTIEFICDVNNNGSFEDGSDYIVGHYTTTGGIPANSSVPFTYTNTFPGSSCTPSSNSTSLYINIRRNPAGASAQCICSAQSMSPFASTLPLKLLTFTAKPQSQSVWLNWSTASENNVSYMQVERSNDGAKYIPLGRLPASGNNDAVHAYSLLDFEPADGINYYRLKMADRDGAASYSTVQVVRINMAPAVSIYPNPVYGGNLTVQIPEGTVRTVQVYNGLGNLMSKFTAQPNSTSQINTDKWPKGLYSIIIRSKDGKASTEKVIRK